MGLEPSVPTGTGDRVIPTVRNPITLSKSPISYDLAPPVLGQDSDRVRRWLATPEAVTEGPEDGGPPPPARVAGAQSPATGTTATED
jgi:hypothetical protein